MSLSMALDLISPLSKINFGHEIEWKAQKLHNILVALNRTDTILTHTHTLCMCMCVSTYSTWPLEILAFDCSIDRRTLFQ